MGESELASKSFANAVEFDKQHSNAHRHLSTTMAKLGKHKQADEHRQIADKLDADDSSDKQSNPATEATNSSSS